MSSGCLVVIEKKRQKQLFSSQIDFFSCLLLPAGIETIFPSVERYCEEEGRGLSDKREREGREEGVNLKLAPRFQISPRFPLSLLCSAGAAHNPPSTPLLKKSSYEYIQLYSTALGGGRRGVEEGKEMDAWKRRIMLELVLLYVLCPSLPLSSF